MFLKCTIISRKLKKTFLFVLNKCKVNSSESEKEPMHLYLFSPKPPSMNLTAKVKLTLDPTCRYTIKIKPFPLGVLGNLARYYSPLILANVVVVLLMAFRSQLLSLENKESNSFIFVAIKEGAKPYYVLTIGKLIIHFLR